MTLEELIRILMANGTSPWMDQVYQDLALMIGFLVLTMVVECGAFWFIFKQKFTGEEGNMMLLKMLSVILVLNILTFLFGAAIYLAVT